VRDLLESAAEQLANEVSGVRIEVPEGLPVVRLDVGLMEQALCNLLLNAAEHGRNIKMSAVIEDGALRLRVHDDGPGIAPGEETKVFEKFHRGPNARPGGTGLGLSIVQGIARAHGGDATAKGATFTIRVPV
jgi:two-component system, OmpR family, sensor histidine kinase KdpD